MSSSDKKTQQTNTFPSKLYTLLSDESISDTICWLPHGKSWKILRPSKLADEILPRYFPSLKYASFRRQVNAWGFNRITEGYNQNSYFHEMFMRDRPELVPQIQRPPTAAAKRKNSLKHSSSTSVSSLGSTGGVGRSSPTSNSPPRSSQAEAQAKSVAETSGIPSHASFNVATRATAATSTSSSSFGENHPMPVLSSTEDGATNQDPSSFFMLQQQHAQMLQQQQQLVNFTIRRTSEISRNAPDFSRSLMLAATEGGGLDGVGRRNSDVEFKSVLSTLMNQHYDEGENNDDDDSADDLNVNNNDDDKHGGNEKKIEGRDQQPQEANNTTAAMTSTAIDSEDNQQKSSDTQEDSTGHTLQETFGPDFASLVQRQKNEIHSMLDSQNREIAEYLRRRSL